ncbi:uncharacterized protein [Lepeophtheirus salmonis]|uniref:uncharacterized protein isoform X1 n=1 Tax=Lepeophtheirus salmonis TaxID=72036 RepID=UPI001AEA61CB|nr:uncharacterized protein LOC121128001 isoform X1 [Lepeophtheirus salmonis]
MFISIMISYAESIDAKDISVVVSTLQDPRPPTWSKAISPSFKKFNRKLGKFQAVRDLNELNGDVYGLQSNFKAALLRAIILEQSNTVDLELTTSPSGSGIIKFDGLQNREGWTLLEIKATVIKPLD